MSKFLKELQRRNVFKAAITYVVISWTLLQVAALVFPMFKISDSILRFIFIALAIGFPFWLVFAYLFEWTPGGLKKTNDIDSEPAVQKLVSKRLNRVIISFLALAVVLLITDRLVDFRPSADSEFKNTIAVLPFENLGKITEDQYLVNGLTYELIYRLTQLDVFDKITPRSSIKALNGKVMAIEEIADLLGVNYLVEGTFSKVDSQMIITVDLLDVHAGKSIFTQRYYEPWSQVFKLQSDIVGDILSNFDGLATEVDEQVITKAPASNKKAYALLLRGNLELDENRFEDAIQFYKEALEIDPAYVDAWFKMAEATHMQSTIFGNLSPEEVYKDCMEYLEIGLKLSENRRDLLIYQGSMKMFTYLDFRDLENTFESAPSNHYHHTHLLHALWSGKHTFLLNQMPLEIDRDPLVSYNYYILAYAQYNTGQFNKAIKTVEEGILLNKSSIELVEVLGKLHLYNGNLNEAKTHLSEALDLARENGADFLEKRILAHLAILYFREGNKKEYERIKNQYLLEQESAKKSAPYTIAQLFGGIGNSEEAINWLETAYDEKDIETIWIFADPILKPLRNERAYKQILRQMGIGDGH